MVYTVLVICFIAVGEEDEVSIKEVAEMIVEAMNFNGEVLVSFLVIVVVRSIRHTYIYIYIYIYIGNKNLAIANRLRVSCAHNTLRALIVTQSP